MSAELYPPADHETQWFEDRVGGDRMTTNTGVLHTTEGTSWPDYDGGLIAPNMTGRPNFKAKGLDWRQHFRANTSSRALRNEPGGVQTNTLNVFQVELVGTCDPTHRRRWGSMRAGQDYVYWPEASQWALEAVADMMRWAASPVGIPLTSGLKWIAYPDSANPAKWARMGNAAWTTFSGWCGHQHVPENVHGDPGDIDIAFLLARARGDAPPTEDDMQLTDKITIEGKDFTVEQVLRNTIINFRQADTELAGFKSDVAAEVAALKDQIAALQSGGVDPDAVAAKVVEGIREQFAK